VSSRPNPLAGIAQPVDLVKRLDDFARRVLPGNSLALARSTLHLVSELFAGRHWDFQPLTLRYHDAAHTFQATACFLDLVAGHNAAERAAPLHPREIELGIATMLFHDIGYVKQAGDFTGTGAKYTHCHVLRSTALAATLLPTLGLLPEEIEMVLGCIRCTGLNGDPRNTRFRDDSHRTIGAMVATADYLGQMAAPEYPDKLQHLYAEFVEADEFANIPAGKRAFRSADELIGRTRTFWDNFVHPKLIRDCADVLRYLAAPAGGPNAYLDAVRENLFIIAGRAAAAAGTAAPFR
jgi:hypothetical protein